MIYDSWKDIPLSFFWRDIGKVKDASLYGIKASVFEALCDNHKNPFIAQYGYILDLPQNVFNNLTYFAYYLITNNQALPLRKTCDVLIAYPDLPISKLETLILDHFTLTDSYNLGFSDTNVTVFDIDEKVFLEKLDVEFSRNDEFSLYDDLER